MISCVLSVAGKNGQHERDCEEGEDIWKRGNFIIAGGKECKML